MKGPKKSGWKWTARWRWPWEDAVERIRGEADCYHFEVGRELKEIRAQLETESVQRRAMDGCEAKRLAQIEKRVAVFEELVAVMWTEAIQVPESETDVFFAKLKAMFKHDAEIKTALERLRERRG